MAKDSVESLQQIINKKAEDRLDNDLRRISKFFNDLDYRIIDGLREVKVTLKTVEEEGAREATTNTSLWGLLWNYPSGEAYDHLKTALL